MSTTSHVETSIDKTGKSDAVTVNSVVGSIEPYTVVLSAAAPAAARVGDVLYDSAGRIYLIIAINGDVLLVQAFGTGTGSTAPSTGAATIEEAYNEPADWATDLNDTTIYNTGDSQIGTCYDNGAFTSACTIANGITGDHALLTVHKDHRHDGTLGTGARFVPTADIDCVSLNGDTTAGEYHVVEWLECDYGNTYSGIGFRVVGQKSGARNCLVQGLQEASNFAFALYLADSSTAMEEGHLNPYVVGCCVCDCEQTSAGNRYMKGLSVQGGGRGRICIGNTVHDIRNQNGTGEAECIEVAATKTTYPPSLYRNNIATDPSGTTTGSKVCYDNTGGDQDHNIASDTTANGTNSIDSVASNDLFVSNSAPYDLRLKSGSAAEGAGEPFALLVRLSAELINGTEPTWHEIVAGLDATLNGSMTSGDWVDDDGKYCLDFDGTDDYANISATSEITIADSDMSAGCWFKTTETTFASILTKTDTNANRGFAIDLEAGGTVRAIFMDDSLKGVTGAGSSLNDDDWHHVMVTRDTLGNIVLYVDGVSAGTDTGVTDDLLDSAIDLVVGARNNTATDFFTGRIDEVTLWNICLTADEVKCLHRAGRGERSFTDSVLTRPGPGYRYAPSRTGNMGDAATLIDCAHRVGVSDNNLTGTNIEAGDWVDDGGLCIDFDGSTEQFLGTNATLTAAKSLTIMGWLKWTTTSPSGQVAIGWRNAANTHRAFLGTGNNTPTGDVRFFFDAGSTNYELYSVGGGYNDNAWHHLAGVYDGAKIHLYIDGVYDGSLTATGNPSFTEINLGLQDMECRLDDCQFYDRALDRDEIAAIHAAGRGDDRGTKNMAPTVPSLVPFAYDFTGHNRTQDGLGVDIGGDQFAPARSSTVIMSADKTGFSNAATIIGQSWNGDAGFVDLDATPANTFAGHTLVDNNSDVWLITAISGTRLDIQPFGIVGAPELGSCTIEEAYNEGGDWANDLADAAIYSSGDTQIADFYANGTFTSKVEISSGTTGVVKTIARAAAGNEHDGSEGTGALLAVNTDTFDSSFSVTSGATAPVVIQDLEFSPTASKATTDGCIGLYNDSEVNEVHRCLLYNFSYANGDCKGIVASATDVVTNNGLYLVGKGTCRDAIAIRSIEGLGSIILNNTVVDTESGDNVAYDAYGIEVINDTDYDVKNNISLNTVSPSGLVGDYSFGGTNPDSLNNLSSDATADDAGGTGHVINETPADVIVSATAPYDLTLKSGSAAFEAGVDLGTTPDQVELDITRRDRDAQADTWSIGCFQLAAAGGGVTVSPAAAIAIAKTIAPTVVLGSTSATPAAAIAIAKTIDPVVLYGSISFTPAAAITIAKTLGPTVVLSSITISPAVAKAIAKTINPTVSAGGDVNVTSAAAIAIARTIDPTVLLGSISYGPGAAVAIARTIDPTVILGPVTPGGPLIATAIARTVDPVVVAGGDITISPAAAKAIAKTTYPIVILSSVAVSPGPAVAIARTVNPSLPGVIEICVVAGQIYTPGAVTGEVYTPGAKAGEIC